MRRQKTPAVARTGVATAARSTMKPGPPSTLPSSSTQAPDARERDQAVHRSGAQPAERRGRLRREHRQRLHEADADVVPGVRDDRRNVASLRPRPARPGGATVSPPAGAGGGREVASPPRLAGRGDAGFEAPRRSGCPDLNWGPLRPERSALPGCATPRSAPVWHTAAAPRVPHRRPRGCRGWPTAPVLSVGAAGPASDADRRPGRGRAQHDARLVGRRADRRRLRRRLPPRLGARRARRAAAAGRRARRRRADRRRPADARPRRPRRRAGPPDPQRRADRPHRRACRSRSRSSVPSSRRPRCRCRRWWRWCPGSG